MDLARRLQEAIDLKGVTSYELAKDSRVDESTISRILHRITKKPSKKTINSLALCLQVDPEWLRIGNEKATNNLGNKSEEPEQPYNNITHMERIIKAHEETIAALKRENELLRMQLGLSNKQTGT